VAVARAGGPSIREHLLNAVAMNTSRTGYYAARAGDKRGRTVQTVGLTHPQLRRRQYPGRRLR
jgi:hypothetical protein